MHVNVQHFLFFLE
jgi:hypothetical protein